LFEKSIFVHVRGEGYRRIPYERVFPPRHPPRQGTVTVTHQSRRVDTPPAAALLSYYSAHRPPPRGTTVDT
jgi:hypothetical protein